MTKALPPLRKFQGFEKFHIRNWTKPKHISYYTSNLLIIWHGWFSHQKTEFIPPASELALAMWLAPAKGMLENVLDHGDQKGGCTGTLQHHCWKSITHNKTSLRLGPRRMRDHAERSPDHLSLPPEVPDTGKMVSWTIPASTEPAQMKRTACPTHRIMKHNKCLF